jgi:pimeloyl-ACP methyl ester carboxylesterase
VRLSQLAEHSATGSANTQLGCQRERPSLYDLVEQMKALTLPTLSLTGDEDFLCLVPGILMKRNIPTAALSVMPNCGHAVSLQPVAAARRPSSRGPATSWIPIGIPF